jgi:hypothetical protein
VEAMLHQAFSKQDHQLKIYWWFQFSHQKQEQLNHFQVCILPV